MNRYRKMTQSRKPATSKEGRRCAKGNHDNKPLVTELEIQAADLNKLLDEIFVHLKGENLTL